MRTGKAILLKNRNFPHTLLPDKMRLPTLLAAILLLFYYNTLFAQSYKLAERNGFRDAKLGMLKNELLGLVEEYPSDYAISTKGASYYANAKTYKRPGDKLEIGPFKIGSISYHFYKGRLSHISMWISGEHNVAGIRNVFLKEYGQPDKLDHLNQSCLWESGAVRLRFDQRTGSDAAYVFISNTVIMEQRKIDAKKNNKSVSSDL